MTTIARGRELLTPEQRQALMQIPEDEWIVGTYYTFSKRDLDIINKRRREENRLGFAVQLAVLRYPPTLISKASQIQLYITYQNKLMPPHLRLVFIHKETTRFGII